VFLTGRGPLESGFGPCISCGRCLDACPLGLEPDQVSVRIEVGRTLETESFGPLDCYECGSCSYVCPSARPLMQFMQVASNLRLEDDDRRETIAGGRRASGHTDHLAFAAGRRGRRRRRGVSWWRWGRCLGTCRQSDDAREHGTGQNSVSYLPV